MISKTSSATTTTAAQQQQQQQQQCRLHVVQFYNLLPRAIVCAAVNRSHQKLGVVRDDGTIEIWNVSHAPFVEKSIPGGQETSIEGLAWAGDSRLFSVGLAGVLLEWDLTPEGGGQPRVKHTMQLTGNAAWCVDVSRDDRLLAVGTEGGYINVYRLENEGLQYERILDKQEGRIMCCRFDWTGDFLATGSVDAVRVWDVRNGHAVHKMRTGRANLKQETIVWAVHVLKDFTIVSADSRGRMTLFDGNLGKVLDSISVSKVDLLALAVLGDEDKLYVSGVEPIIRIFQRVANKSDGLSRFIRVNARRLHTHDIKTLVTFGTTSLASGGLDGTLVVSSFPPPTVDKYLPLLPDPAAAQVATEARTVLLRYVNYLEVWTLDGGDDERTRGGRIGGMKILQIRSKNDEHIVCAALSPNGRWIVYATGSAVRLLRYEHNRADPARSRLQRVRNTPERFSAPCGRVDFLPDSSGFFLYELNGTINFFACSPGDDQFFDHKQSIEGSRWLSEPCHLSAVSLCGRYLVCADPASAIVVFERTGADGAAGAGKWKRSISLPRYRLPPTALAIQPGKTRVAVAFTDHKLFLYDFDQFQFVFSTYVRLSAPDCGSPGHPIGGIVFDPRQESALILRNDSHILSVRFGDTTNPLPDGEGREGGDGGGDAKRRKANTDSASIQSKYTLKVVRNCPRLVNIAWLGRDELVAIEANALSMVEHLAPAFRKKAFGKM